MAHGREHDTQLSKLNTETENGRDYGVRVKKRRTKEDFIEFCSMILAYTKYEPHTFSSDASIARSFSSPTSSDGSASESHSSNDTDTAFDGEDPEKVTCFCGKPFGGRLMIECCQCLTWIHLSCAKIRKNNIPDVFTCQQCRESRQSSRKSNRMRTESRRLRVSRVSS